MKNLQCSRHILFFTLFTLISVSYLNAQEGTASARLLPITYETVICEFQNITSHDLTQYDELIGDESDVVNWYEGQPSLNGVDITAMASSVDLSNMPDIWANIIDPATNVTREVDFMYEFDYAPLLTCPTDIIVDSAPNMCGAFVNVPPIGITDDNVIPFSNQRITQNYENFGETLQFDFTGYGLIDTSQPATLTVTAIGDIRYTNEYFIILDENNNELAKVGNTEVSCGGISVSLTIPIADLGDFLTDGKMTFRASPSSYVVPFCPVSQVEMTLDYTATDVSYTFVQNSYNTNGADASDFYYPGTTEVIYTIMDGCGSIDTCSVQITVNPGTTTNRYNISASSETVCSDGVAQLCLNTSDTLQGTLYALDLNGNNSSPDIYRFNIDEDWSLDNDNTFTGAEIGSRTLGFDKNPVDGKIYLLAFAPNNSLIRHLYTMDLTSGILVDLGEVTASTTSNNRPQDITFDAVGNLYTIFLDGELHTIDYTAPALTTTYISAMPLIGAVSSLGLTYNFDNNTLLYASTNTSGITLNQITTSGVVTPLATSNSTCGAQGIEYIAQNLVYVIGSNCNYIFTWDFDNNNVIGQSNYLFNSTFSDLLYVPTPPEGSILWTDDTGNTLDTTRCIVVSPTNTTTYTATYAEPNGCIDISEITIEALTSIPVAPLNFGVCEYEDMTGVDLTQYNSFVTDINNVVEWYIGQPSVDGTNITTTADSTDISGMPDLWVLVYDGISQCTQEIDITYETDYSPTITCPASITVNNDPNICGAFVTIPLATATDDSIAPVRGTQSQFQAYTSGGQILEFEFNSSNIDLSQPVSLLIEAAGDLRYSYENYTISDENGNTLLNIGGTGVVCGSTTGTYNFSTVDIISLFADNSLMLTAEPSFSVGICNTDDEGVKISLLYTPITPQYVNIFNDYNGGGANASDFYPNGTTTVTYMVVDACGSTDICSIDITVNQDTLRGEDFYFVACGNLENYDLTQLNEYFEGTNDEPTTPVWYEGQPSQNGTEVDTTTNSVDITAMPNIWVLVLNPTTECHTEIQVTYGLDMTPQITCPAPVVVNAEAGICGAQVTVPLATATDDNFSPVQSQQTLFQEYLIEGNTLTFDFDGSNIDASEPIDLNIIVSGNIYYYRYFNIYDEANNFLGRAGSDRYNECDTSSDNFMISKNNLATFLADDTLTVYAIPNSLPVTVCEDNNVRMTIAYKGIVPDYIDITNDYTYNGADASGFYPSGTTVVTYTAVDSCGNASVCSTTVTVNQVPTTGTPFNATLCGNPTAMDLSQIYDAFTPADTILWFSGQPSAGGIDISATSSAVDLTAALSLWAQIAHDTTGCLEEREIVYEVDTPPVLTCPSDITVTNDAGICGAQVTVPLVTATDDNVTAYLATKNGFAPYNGFDTLNFAFGSTDIDLSQPAELGIIAYGDIRYSSQYYTIYDENGNVVAQLGESGENCGNVSTLINLSASELAAYYADNTMTFSAVPSATVYPYSCSVSGVRIILYFESLNPIYTFITNDYNNGGPDASDYYPPGITSVSFFAVDGCGNIDTCTVDVTVDLDVPVLENFNFTACGDLENYDLTQYEPALMDSTTNSSVINWYEGQPSINGVDITATADSVDLTTLPDLWAFITDDTTNCQQEIHLTYQFDYPPEITCPADIVIDAEAGECGAMVNIPLATITDDNVQPIGSQTIFDRLVNSSGQTLYFDFDATNIDTLQPVTITAQGFGNIDNPYEYYRLANEDGAEVGLVTDTNPTCGVTPLYTFLISSDNWAEWLADDTLSFTANEFSIDIFCPTNGIEMTLSYTPLVNEYVEITNNYNDSGADASGFYPSGTTTVTYTATDGCGNMNTCSLNVTVNPGMTTDAMEIVSYTDTVCAGGEVELCLTSNEVLGTLYALNADNDEGADIARYFVNPADGQLTLDRTFTGADFDMEEAIAFDINPVDSLIYLMTRYQNYYAKLYTIDLIGGIVNDLGQVTFNNLGSGVSSFTFDNSGNMYYIQSASLRLLDYTASPPTNTGVATISSDSRSGLTYNFDNNTFIYSEGYGNYIYVYEYDINTDTNTLLAGPFSVPGGGDQCSAKAIEYVGDGLVHIGDGSGCDKMYVININTGNISPLLEPTGSYSSFADLMYFSPFDLGTTVWTDEIGNELGTGKCILLMPDTTSTYTATYTSNDTGCGDVSQITIQVAPELASGTFDVGICDPASLANFDWTQYNEELMNDNNESVEWYIGQPSMGGTNITATADSTDLTNTPDIWALITNNLSICTQEVDVNYQLDTPPVLECPAAITVNNDPDTCGAYVTVPMLVFTDDLLTLIEPTQTITKNINSFSSIYFDFDTTNIDLSQGAVLTVEVIGNTQYSYEYFTIYNDNNSLGRVGNEFSTNCTLETETFNISAAGLTTNAADGVIRFRASPSSSIDSELCDENYVRMTLSYTTPVDEYIHVKNSYTDKGADASGYYPPGMTTVTYIVTDGCGTSDTCSVDITVNQAILSGEDFDFVACGDLENYDLTQYDFDFTGFTYITGKIANWYDGQPSENGTDITVTANSADLTNVTDLWLLVTDTINNCAEEIDANYYFDFGPTITCPTSITVNNEPDTCGAFVAIPLATAIDDNATPLLGEQSIYIEYLNVGDTLQFDFDATNIDTTQAMYFLVGAYGNLSYFNNGYYSIYNEGDDLIGTLTSFSACGFDSENFTLPDSLNTFTQDGLLSFTAVPTNVGIGCNNEGVEMILRYTPIAPEYVTITNSHNNGGADASGFYQVGTTTVTYIAKDACGNTDTCTVDIIVQQDTLQGDDFHFFACGDLSAYDLTELNDDLSDYGQSVAWYEGQPTAGGTDISLNADSIDLTSMPDIWAVVTNNLINCSTEIDVSYTFDYPPVIICPANITVDADTDTCGAYVTLPMATATDDNVTEFPSQQSILINHTDYEQVMNFVFNVSNIDTSQPATLHLQASGELYYSDEYYNIFNENDSLITQFGKEAGFNNCRSEYGTLTISAADLATFAADDTITFTAIPTTSVYPYYCTYNYMQMTLSYTPITPEYVIISNDQNDGGADASGFYPSGTTTVTYTATDACGNAVTCSTDVTVIQPVITGETLSAIICSGETTSDLTQLNEALTSLPGDAILWFDGQPSNGGTDITDMAQAYDLSTLPDLWVQVIEDTSRCIIERDIEYQIDMPPVITCPADITVDSDDNMCGAEVDLIVTVTDDGLTSLPSKQTIRQDYTSYNQNLQFDFALNNVDTSQDAVLLVNSSGDTGSVFEYFDIFDENGAYIGRLGDEFYSDCVTETFTITIPAANLATFLSDGMISFTADPFDVDIYSCVENYVEMTLSYASPTADTYTITNSYNEGGADASGFYPPGITPVTFIATDGCGNTDTCTVEVTVNQGSTIEVIDIIASADTVCMGGMAELCLDLSQLSESVFWTDNNGNILDSTSCITVMPDTTTTYTATYTRPNGCPNVSEITIGVSDGDLSPKIVNTTICASDTVGGLNLTNYNVDVGSMNDVISWYIGQPSNGGTDITVTADTVDFSNSPDIWALVADTLSNCSQEIQLDYLFDEAPVLSCASIVNVSTTNCGAFVNIPIPTAKDDSLLLLPNEKLTITQDYSIYDQSVIFDFDSTNIDTSQSLELIVSAIADLDSSYDYFNIYDENGSLIGKVGDQSYPYRCSQAEKTFIISAADLATFLADGVLSITADPYYVNTSYCTSQIQMTIDYTAIVPTQYITITNDRNNNGADASGYYPSGTTAVTFFATDYCGNIDTCTTMVVVDQINFNSYTRSVTFCGDSATIDLTQVNNIITNDTLDTIIWHVGQPSTGGTIINNPTAYDLSDTPDIWGRVHDFSTLCISEVQLLYDIDIPPVISCPASVSVDATMGECGAYINLPPITIIDDNVLPFEPTQTIFQEYTEMGSTLSFNFNGSNIDPAQSATLQVRGFGNLEGVDRYYEIFDETGNLIGSVGTYYSSRDCAVVTNSFSLSPADLATLIADDNVITFTAVPSDLIGIACDTDGVTMELSYTQLVDEYVFIKNDYTNIADASGYYPSGTTIVTFTATDGCGSVSTCTVDVTVNQTPGSATLNAENTNLYLGDSTQICIEQDDNIPFEYTMWMNNTADTISYGQNICIIVSPDTTTTYTAISQSQDGCLYEGSVTINVATSPAPFSITNSFSASDPCTCNNDQTENGAGDGTFTEIVTVTGEAGLIIRAAANSRGLSTGVPSNFYESFPGRYQLQFTHLDRVGYAVYIEVSYDNGTTFQTVFDAFGLPLSISNVCAYPVLDFAPSLVEFCETDGLVSINLRETSDNVDFIPVQGYPSISIDTLQYPAPVDFDPATLGGSVYSFTGFYDCESGTGTGGTLEAPAVPLNTCPTEFRVNVPIHQEPSGEATCRPAAQIGQALIEIDHREDYLTPENLMYRLGDDPFQTSNQFIIDEDGEYDLTIMDAQTACMYEFKVVCAVILPIELIFFNAHCDGDEYLLTWKTAFESNVAEFIVERSVNGDTFMPIGKITASGESTTPQHYQYRDDASAGRYYYRLRIVENDGKTIYSDVQVIGCLEVTFDISIFPNPTEGELNILFEPIGTNVINFKLTDILGRTIMEEDIIPHEGLNTKTIDLSKLPPAMYFVILNDGEIVRKVVRK